MKQPTESFKIAKEEQDLKIITHSLNYACCVKYNDRRLSVDKEILTYKIVDTCKVTPSKAKQYLLILQSRGVLEIDHDLVHYVKDNFTQEQSNDIDSLVNSIKTTKNLNN